MTNETKQYLSMYLMFLKEALKKEGCILGIVVNKNDFDESKIAIINKNNPKDGFLISLTDFNDGLI